MGWWGSVRSCGIWVIKGGLGSRKVSVIDGDGRLGSWRITICQKCFGEVSGARFFHD
jgi:hypothetical protein